VHDPDAGAVIGAVDVTSRPARSHPTTPALVTAAAMLTESLLVAQQAVRDELLLARHLPLLDGARGEPPRCWR
jgi:transcriptional regulator of acetoin/glycerol metabolism